MLFAALKLACSYKFLDYGRLLYDKSLYNKSINPIYVGKQSADIVVEFMNQLEQKITILCSLLHHASKSNTDFFQSSTRVNFIQ